MPDDENAESDEYRHLGRVQPDTAPREHPAQAGDCDQKYCQASARDRDRTPHLQIAVGGVRIRPLLIWKRHARAFRAAMFSRQ